MPKRPFLYFLGLVLLASLAYYGYSRWQDSREKVDLWTLVPDDAVFVVETNDHTNLVAHLRETELWNSLVILPFAQDFQDNLAWLDSIAPGNQRLERFFDKKNILTSVHLTGKAEVEVVYYVPVNSVGEHRFLRTLTENIGRSDAFSETSREYEGEQLIDVANTYNESRFTYFSYHNNIIISPSPALIEAIVRRTGRGTPVSVADGFKHANYLGQPDVYANVFINYRNLPSLLGLFMKEELMPQLTYLATLCQNGMLELKLEKDKIFLNGFSNPEQLKGSLHRNLNPTKPRPFGIKAFVPTRTAMLLNFSLEEIARMRAQNTTTPPDITLETTIDSLAHTFSNEVAVAYLETYSLNATPVKVAFAHLGNPTKANALLNKLAGQHAGKSYAQVYGSYNIQLQPMPELPAHLFGSLFSGFEQSYTVQLDNYLVFSPDLATLKTLLDDISAEQVWSKSAVQKSFLEETLQETNFSLYLNTASAWYMLNHYVQAENREDLLQNAALIKRFNQISLQFAKVDSQYYTSFIFRRQNRSKTGEDAFGAPVVLSFDAPLVTRTFPVLHPLDKSQEVIVQDSAHVLHRVGASGKRDWVDSVRVPVQGSIKQVALGKEKKLSYLYATANRIHAVDNQGSELENFPFNVADSLQVQHLAVYTYEKEGNYRLLVDDEAGNLYLYNSSGAAIPGWQPRRMDGKLAVEPQHIRVAGQDVLLVLLENGYVYALNEQGETYPGFPFSVKSPLTSAAIVNSGPSLRRTDVTVITKYGQVIIFNLQGKVLKREQLPRPSKRAMFTLVPESSSDRSFVVVRQDLGSVVVFDDKLKPVFEKRYITSAPKIVQYFHFGGKNKVYAITETGPQKTYLYNAKGNLIGEQALESSQPVTIYYNETTNSYTLYKVFQGALQKINFKVLH